MKHLKQFLTEGKKDLTKFNSLVKEYNLLIKSINSGKTTKLKCDDLTFEVSFSWEDNEIVPQIVSIISSNKSLNKIFKFLDMENLNDEYGAWTSNELETIVQNKCDDLTSKIESILRKGKKAAVEIGEDGDYFVSECGRW